MTEHKHADILRMLAADSSLRVERLIDGTWYVVSPGTVLEQPNAVYKVVAETLTINGSQFPKPTPEGPYRVRIIWGGPADKSVTMGRKNFEHRTYQAAQDHFNALVKASRGD